MFNFLEEYLSYVENELLKDSELKLICEDIENIGKSIIDFWEEQLC